MSWAAVTLCAHHLAKIFIRLPMASEREITALLRSLKICGVKVGHGQVYDRYARVYDALRQFHDRGRAVLPALRALCPALEGTAVIVEMGAGTGILTNQLAPFAARVHAFDASAHMVEFGRAATLADGHAHCDWGVAENRALPRRLSRAADLAVAGWTICYLKAEKQWGGWEDGVDRALSELARVTRPGGVVAVLETLGSGHSRAVRRSHYHARLEEVHHFRRRELRTDFVFPSAKVAFELTQFFFGPRVSRRVRQHAAAEGQYTLPETSGLWWKQTPLLPPALLLRVFEFVDGYNLVPEVAAPKGNPLPRPASAASADVAAAGAGACRGYRQPSAITNRCCCCCCCCCCCWNWANALGTTTHPGDRAPKSVVVHEIPEDQGHAPLKDKIAGPTGKAAGARWVGSATATRSHS